MTTLVVIGVGAGFVGLALHYRRSAARPPELRYRPSPLIDHLLDTCPILREPFRPTPWAFNRHCQLAVLAWREARAAPFAFDAREHLTLADGGTTSLDWAGLDDRALGATTPTVVVLPTICGDGPSMRRLVRSLRRRLGWRIVVCNRRGHGDLPLTTPRISTLGATADLRTQLAHVRRRVGTAPLYALGSSAGSALLVRWLGEEGVAAPVIAAVALCPGYDTTRAFHRIHRVYDRYLVRALRRYFLERHSAILRALPKYEHVRASRTVGELHDRQYALAGFASADDFHRHTNPMAVAHDVRVPLLILNAADDPVCPLANVREHETLVADVRDALLVLTARGSHCAFFEGWRPRSWAHRLIADYLRAVHEHAMRADADWPDVSNRGYAPPPCP